MDSKKLLLIAAIIIVVGIGFLFLTINAKFGMYSKSSGELADYSGGMQRIGSSTSGPMAPSAGGTQNIGLSAGGAKDIGNFRENIKNNFLPLVTDITYEGLFYDYYFDTGRTEECTKLFCPSYSYALSKDPISNAEEHYLSVGLNSGIKESDFKRKALNLVIVLDVSGSMGDAFNSYYYDGGKQVELTDGKRKIEVARESVVALLGHLNEEDRVAIVTFQDNAQVIRQLLLANTSDMPQLKASILSLNANGGTQLSAGMDAATEQYKPFLDASQEYYENRIIYLTDAQPNLGDTSQAGFIGRAEDNSRKKIYTTFIGIGVDFNTELVDRITKIKGANYYSVHSPKQFMDRMDTEFEYMVTPLVFNLFLKLDAPGWTLEKIYGSPEANEATGELMKINTLFPSKQTENQTKGGLVLLKLKKGANAGALNLKVTYEDRNSKPGSDEKLLIFPSVKPDYYENTGIRKGILLARYANLLKNWISDERDALATNGDVHISVESEHGITLPPDGPLTSEWERQSTPLRVSEGYKSLFRQLSTYFGSEMNALQDKSLQQELDILRNLSTYSP